MTILTLGAYGYFGADNCATKATKNQRPSAFQQKFSAPLLLSDFVVKP